MTREEAIAKLDDLRDEVYNEDSDGYSYAQAIDMAKESMSADSVRIEVYRDLYGKYIDLKHKTEWIPCSDRLPNEHIYDDGYVEPSEKVLVCTDSETILTSRYWGDRQSKAEDPDRYADWVDIDWWHNVIAWMPLPEPYGESEVKE